MKIRLSIFAVLFLLTICASFTPLVFGLYFLYNANFFFFLFTLPVTVPLLYSMSVLILAFFLSQTRLVFKPIKEGIFKVGSEDHVNNWLRCIPYAVYNEFEFFSMIKWSFLFSWVIGFFGVRIGRRSYVMRFFEPELVDVGEGVIVSYNTGLVTHIIEGNTILFKRIVIGDNTIIGPNTTILPGVNIGRDVIVGANSLITKNKLIPDGIVCYGQPVKFSSE